MKTLGYHRDMAKVVLGVNSPAVKYLEDKIAESPNGEDEEVVVPEQQMVYLLVNIHNNVKD